MQLRLRMASKVLTCDWSTYALFRDNVQHFVEGGSPTDRFHALHAIERAVSDGHHTIDAARLRGEVIGALFTLRKLTFRDAAISLRTRALLTNNAQLPEVRATVRASQAGWQLPVAGAAHSRLLLGAKPFIVAVLGSTKTAVDGDTLEVEREGSAPRSLSVVTHAPRGERSRLSPVPRLATISVVALLAGCAAPPPKAPEPAGERPLETKREQPERDERSPVVAPPPAWGNKVVMTVE